VKSILTSKRANVFYLSECRVMVKDGVVTYLTEDKRSKQYWNIPVANTSVILLGIGTSITQSAVRMLASAGVMIGFSGNGGTPLLAGTEVEWLSPQSEYRPTEYIQGWLSFWFDDQKRLELAKVLQSQRLGFLKSVWNKDSNFQKYNFYVDSYDIDKKFKTFAEELKNAVDTQNLLLVEANLTKHLYAFAMKNTFKNSSFTRNHEGEDEINRFLSHGNYLAYGLAASALWTLGIPHGFALMHGKTRRGALVFDVADLIKDAIILPLAFISAKEGIKEREFREEVIEYFAKYDALNFMFEQIKNISLRK
jgi:CRISPR-associated protein Cas1